MPTSLDLPFTRRQLLLAGASLATLQAGTAMAAPWPSQPLRLIVPYPAGGVNDVVARLFGERLARTLGQAVVVDNKPGAGATIGMAELAKAHDQHTLAFGAISPLTLNPYLMKVAYDPLTDILPVASVMYAPVYVMATRALQAQRFEDVLRQAKTTQGVSVATSGYGTLGHIMVEQLIRATGGRFVHVPYKGGSQLITDAAGAQFDLLLANPFGPINALIAQGKLRVLATTGPQRAASFPQLPTLGELGWDKANLTSLFGFYAPKGTEAAVVAHLNAAINQLLRSQDMRQRLLQLDNVPLPLSAEAFGTLIRKDYALNGVVIEQAGIQAQ
ncbi:tripartite tricarboxylate transporter substrate binding protein [Comamonas aquatica]|uniref:Bug family tripartite tricarboxylate transporter substrate binding protein n=1 Tax=Comamonas aquatica TaxID=225991 RepID=UPI0022DD75E6|nr:tripartite tricarboxylate transporter substrate binding protein [Comamonas aquatica]MDH1902507.1 tripartite tricarboxylate transporter substrate binding protein [Comamonas aquatica]WBM43181.1 tripartite tricarboxylate transporter substrate binding protein [Comamonas aquatica]